MTHVRELIFIVFSGNHFTHEKNRMRTMGFSNDISLKIIERDVEHIENRISNLIVAVLQMLSLETLYKKKDNQKRPGLSIDGKTFWR